MTAFGYPFDIELVKVEPSALIGSLTLHYRITPGFHYYIWQEGEHQCHLNFTVEVSSLASTENLDLVPEGADFKQMEGNHFIGRLQNIRALHKKITDHRQEVNRLTALLAQRVRSLALDSEMPVEESVILGSTAFELEHQDYWSDYSDTKYWAEDALAITKVKNLTYAKDDTFYSQPSETPVSAGVSEDEDDYITEL